MAVGEGYIASLYHALRNGPQWNDSLLLITFDENGGYYDHVPPPAAPRPDSKPPLRGQRSLSKGPLLKSSNFETERRARIWGFCFFINVSLFDCIPDSNPV